VVTVTHKQSPRIKIRIVYQPVPNSDFEVVVWDIMPEECTPIKAELEAHKIRKGQNQMYNRRYHVKSVEVVYPDVKAT